MDLLSDVLRIVRLSGAVLFHGEFSAPWSVSAPDSAMMAPFLVPGAKRLILFHIVAEGRCWAEVEGIPPITLGPGDVLTIPGGDAHVMSNPSGGTPTRIATLLSPPPWPELPLVVHGGGGEVTRILCGFLHWDDAVFNPVFTNLPRVLCVHAEDEISFSSIEASLRQLIAEARAHRPGSNCLLTRLTEVPFIEVLRRHMESLGDNQTGWLAALRDRTVSSALQLMHADPTHTWTVEELGRRVGLSRSALAERCRHLLGQPIMHYLMRWRLQLAAQLLRETDDGISAIASRVGYESEAAFNRAFKRYLGEPPATWRNGTRPVRSG